MSEFRKKPVVIEAVQYPGVPAISPDKLASGDFHDLGAKTDELLVFEEWLEPHARKADRWPCRYKGRSLIIPTLEGDHEAQPGDWIIVGVQGEIYPCKPDIFTATYEPVGSERPTAPDVGEAQFEAAVHAAAKIEMDREGAPYSRSQEEFYADASEMVEAILAALQSTKAEGEAK